MKINKGPQRCLTYDEKTLRKLDTSFSIIGQTIIGKRIAGNNKKRISNMDSDTILLPYITDLKLSRQNSNHQDVLTKPKQPQHKAKILKNKNSERNDHTMTIQFQNTINNNITIINNIIQQPSEKQRQSDINSPPTLKKFNPATSLKSVLKQPKTTLLRKSVRFQHSNSAFDLRKIEKEEMTHKSSKMSNKTVKEKDNDRNLTTINNKDIATMSGKIFYSKEKKIIDDKDKYNREIDRLPKCHCEKEIGVFKGFSALTCHNRNTIHYDKLTILINKSILCNSNSSHNDYANSNNTDSTNKQINFFGLYHGINGDYTSSILKKDIHKYIFNNKKVLLNTESAIIKAHKIMEMECYKNHNKETFNDGACSLILCEIYNIIYISNVGNSKCVISSAYGSEIYNLASNHTPLCKSEIERIQSKASSCEIKIDSNGKNARIYPSGLNVTRVVGFTSAKGNSLNKENGSHCHSSCNGNGIDNGIISQPDIMTIQSSDEMDFIIMASEGVVNYLSNNDMIRLAYVSIKESLYANDSYEAMLDRIIATIAKESVKRESKGSISLILLSLSNLRRIYKEKLILKVNLAINNLKTDKEEYNLLYPILFNSPQFNMGKRAKTKPRQNSNNNSIISNYNRNITNSNVFSPLHAFKALKIQSEGNTNFKNFTQDEAKTNNQNANAINNNKNDYKNSIECITEVNAGQSGEKQKKKKKKMFFCLCWR